MKKIMEKSDLELRMYFLVPYNISPIQQAIQAGHAALKYALEYGKDNPNHPVWDFIENHETWIILNGGTTNNTFEIGTGIPLGTLNKCVHDIAEYNASASPKLEIGYSVFQEPDLNDALTAICLIVDERVFNREDYPDFKDWLWDKGLGKVEYDDPRYKTFANKYASEVGKDIAFLKNLLNTKKLA